MATPSCDGYKEVKEMKGEDLEDVGTVFGVTGGDEDFQSGNDNEEGGYGQATIAGSELRRLQYR